MFHLSFIGNEYCVLVLCSWEPLKEDGSPAIDSSKSLCNPHVFNTAITRAESLVVAVGDPFSLLKTEEHILKDRNYKEKGKCWSNYLGHCFEHGTIRCSKTSETEGASLGKVCEAVGDRLGRDVKV